MASSSLSDAAPKACLAHCRQLAADSITLIWCQVAGTAWQKAWVALAALGAKLGVTTNNTPLVPSDKKPSPAFTAPMPTALDALSPAPPATTMPAFRPSCAATLAVSWPPGALPSTARGMWASVIFVSANNAGDQARLATSSQAVPLASDKSVMCSPVSISRT